MSYKDVAIATIQRFEGNIPWMYLDTVGNVTAGTGHMLPDASSACELPFWIDGRPALLPEIEADFARVKAMTAGKVAQHYRTSSACVLTEDAMTADLAKTVDAFEQVVHNGVKGYDDLPDEWKVALLDMAYNLGPEGLLDKYPHFIQDVEARNGQAASAQCHRNGVSMVRNDWTRNQFWPQ